MFGGIGGEVLFRDINKPWYLTANFHWVKQRNLDKDFLLENTRLYRSFKLYMGNTIRWCQIDYVGREISCKRFWRYG